MIEFHFHKTTNPVFEYRGKSVLKIQEGYVFFIQKNSKGRVEVSRNLNLTNPFWVNPGDLKELRSVNVIIKNGEYLKKEIDWILKNYTEPNEFQKLTVKENTKIVEESEKIREYKEGRWEIKTVPSKYDSIPVIIKRKIEFIKKYRNELYVKLEKIINSIYYKTIRFYWRNVGRVRVFIKPIKYKLNDLKWDFKIWFRTPIKKRISRLIKFWSIRKGNKVAFTSATTIAGKRYILFYEGVWDGEKVMFKNQNNEKEIVVRGKQHLIKL